MMTESDIRALLAQAEPFRPDPPAIECYDLDEIAGPIERRADARSALFDVAAEVDAFLARDPAP